MYIPSSYAEQDNSTLFAFIEAHPLAVVVTSSASDGLIATHLPVILERSAGPLGTLIGHFARANPHARALLKETSEALVIFSGPDAYVTPGWYPTKQETGRVVPTWNYVAVHAYAAVSLRQDPEFLREHLEMLTQHHEAERSHSWQVSDAPDEYITGQMKAIVGVELRISRLEGKWKMSQNRSEADIDGVVHGLRESSAVNDHAVAAIVDERRPAK